MIACPRIAAPVCLAVMMPALAGAVDFGSRHPTADFSSATILIENPTGSEVALTGAPLASVAGADAADFAVVRQPSAAAIPAGGSVAVKVRFNPSAAGARSATLEVPTGSGALGTVSVPLTGTGETFAVTDLNTAGPHDLSGAQAGTLRLSAGALNLTGDLQVAGDLVIAGGSVALNGHTLAVGRNFRLDANVMIDLGGGASLDVGGNAYLANGTLDLDGGALAVGGDLRVEIVSEAVQGTLAFAAGLGFFRMDGAGDTALVGGDFRMDSQSSHAGLLSGGALEIKGDFTQDSTANFGGAQSNFSASGAHVTILSGTVPQTVSFGDPVDSRFRTLDVRNPSVALLPSLMADTLVTNGNSLPSLTVRDLPWVLAEDVAILGDLVLAGESIALSGHSLSVGGDLTQPGGDLDLQDGALAVAGDYRLQAPAGGDVFTHSPGNLLMADPACSLLVQGDFFTDSRNNHAANLTAGTFELKGDFHQLSTASLSGTQNNFQASGAHRFVLSGAAAQTVQFEDPGASHFAVLDIQNAAITLLPSLVADSVITNGNDLPPLTVQHHPWTLGSDATIAGDLVLADEVIRLAGFTLTVEGGVTQPDGQMDLDDGALVVDGDYRIQTDEGGGAYSSSGGSLRMTDPGCSLLVRGSFFTDSTVSHSLLLTEGTFELKGDFTQMTTSSGSVNNFACRTNHVTILSGAAPQTIAFEDPSGNSRFRTLVLQNGALAFTSPLALDFLITNGNALPAVAFDRSFTMTEDLTVAGDLTLLGGTLDVAGFSLAVEGGVLQPGGVFDLGGGSAAIAGDYRLQADLGGGNFTLSSGRLEMTDPADSLLVGGSFITDSAQSHTGRLTAGTLALGGDLRQLSSVGASVENFNTAEPFAVHLVGSGEQTIAFDDPSLSRLATLEILNAPGGAVTFATRVRVTRLFDHHQKDFTLAPGTADTDFPDFDGDGQRDHLDLFPTVGDSNNNGIPDNATPATYTYEIWQQLHFDEDDPDFAEDAAPLADPDGDRLTNAEEYLMGTNPNAFNASPVQASVIDGGGERRLALTFTRVKPASGSASYEIFAASSPAGAWESGTGTEEILADDGEIETVRWVDTDAPGGAARRFAYLGVTITLAE